METSYESNQTYEFLKLIFGENFDGYLTIWSKDNKATRFISSDSIEESIPFISELAQNTDVFFGMGLIKDNQIEGRGKEEDVGALGAFHLDLDIGVEGHKSSNYPPSIDIAMKMLDECPFTPTIIVRSGNGLHIYWVFKELLLLENEEYKESVAQTLRNFQGFFIERAKEKGYKLDNTSDLTRMLRLPGTFNHKGDIPKEVQILELHSEEDYKYTLQEIQEFLNENNAYYCSETLTKKANSNDILKKCPWMKHCKEDSVLLPEPEWYRMLTVIARCENAETVADDLSSNYPNYCKEETMKKLLHAIQSPGPVSCRYIEENFSRKNANGSLEPYCKKCKYQHKVKSPVFLGINYINNDIPESIPNEPLYKEWMNLCKGSSYTINEKGHLCQFGFNNSKMRLANFLCKVKKEILIDDGLEVKRNFVIDGVLEGGVKLPEIQVEAKEFPMLNWILPLYGIKANIFPRDSGYKDVVRSAIQHLSKNAPLETVYNHVGWRKIQGQWGYLHSKGCIGVENVTVSVDSFLDSYSLPKSENNPRDSLNASYALLKMGSWKVTLPLLSLVYLAPLTEVFRQAEHECNFLVWLHGRTGTRKTSVATLFLSHFRNYSKSPPATFSDTANSLEKKAFHCKDTILLIDDYYPNGTSYDKNRMNQTAQHLIRLYGDKVGKGRMKADTTIRNGYQPRGLALITGEDFINGHSSMARCLGIEISKTDIDLQQLSNAQENHHKYSQAMYGYINWLKDQMDSLPGTLRHEFLSIRNELLSSDNHGRMYETIAWLQIGFKMFLKYAQSLGLMTDDQINEHLEKSLATLIDLIKDMHFNIQEEKPEILFIKTIKAMLDSGDYIVDPLNSGIQFSKKEFKPKAKIIGWEDKEAYYLISEMSFSAACEVLKKQSISFPGSITSLLKSMDEAGLIKTENETTKTGTKVKRTVKKTINKERKRLIHIYKDKLNEALEL